MIFPAPPSYCGTPFCLKFLEAGDDGDSATPAVEGYTGVESCIPLCCRCSASIRALATEPGFTIGGSILLPLYRSLIWLAVVLLCSIESASNFWRKRVPQSAVQGEDRSRYKHNSSVRGTA